MIRLRSLAVSLILAFAAAYIGTLFTAPAIDSWYAALVKPALNPPNWIFAPVWSLLYVCMAIAAWRAWVRRAARAARTGLILYGLQLFVNALWSVVFFALHAPAAAFAVILVLLALICATAVYFYRVDTVAGMLFVPYILWVSFATYLNLAIMTLNI